METLTLLSWQSKLKLLPLLSSVMFSQLSNLAIALSWWFPIQLLTLYSFLDQSRLVI